MQIQLGIGILFFSLPYNCYKPLVTPGWLSDLWSKICCYSIKVEWRDLPVPKLSQLGDQFLVDLAMEASLTSSQLAAFNKCRCAFKVLTLSDIATADGASLEPWAITADLSICNPRSSYRWHRETPSSTDFDSWIHVMSHLTHGHKRLMSPLGPWLCSPHRQPLWHYHPSSNCLFCCNSDYWEIYHPDGSRHLRGQHFFFDHTSTSAPLHLHLASISIVQMGRGS